MEHGIGSYCFKALSNLLQGPKLGIVPFEIGTFDTQVQKANHGRSGPVVDIGDSQGRRYRVWSCSEQFCWLNRDPDLDNLPVFVVPRGSDLKHNFHQGNTVGVHGVS